MSHWKSLTWCSLSLVLACSENAGSDWPADAAADAATRHDAGGGALVDRSHSGSVDGHVVDGRDALSFADAAAAEDGEPVADGASAADTGTVGDELTFGDSSTDLDGASTDDAAQSDGSWSGVMDANTRTDGAIDLGNLGDASGGGLLDPNLVPPRPPTF